MILIFVEIFFYCEINFRVNLFEAFPYFGWIYSRGLSLIYSGTYRYRRRNPLKFSGFLLNIQVFQDFLLKSPGF